MKCTMCGGTNKVKGWRKEKDGTYKEFISNCLASGTKSTILRDIKFLLAQFIRCSTCGPFDPKNLQGNCKSCQYEREEIMSRIWHYGELIGNRDNKQ